MAHEPPLARVHPDAEYWEAFFTKVYRNAERYGATAAMVRFALGIGTDFSFAGAFKAAAAMRNYRRQTGQRYVDRNAAMEFFVFQELLPATCRT